MRPILPYLSSLTPASDRLACLAVLRADIRNTSGSSSARSSSRPGTSQREVVAVAACGFLAAAAAAAAAADPAEAAPRSPVVELAAACALAPAAEAAAGAFAPATKAAAKPAAPPAPPRSARPAPPAPRLPCSLISCCCTEGGSLLITIDTPGKARRPPAPAAVGPAPAAVAFKPLPGAFCPCRDLSISRMPPAPNGTKSPASSSRAALTPRDPPLDSAATLSSLCALLLPSPPRMSRKGNSSRDRSSRRAATAATGWSQAGLPEDELPVSPAASSCCQSCCFRCCQGPALAVVAATGAAAGLLLLPATVAAPAAPAAPAARRVLPVAMGEESTGLPLVLSDAEVPAALPAAAAATMPPG